MTTATPPPAGDDLPDDPAVDPTDAGFEESPELADGDQVFVDEQGNPIDPAGDGDIKEGSGGDGS